MNLKDYGIEFAKNFQQAGVLLDYDNDEMLAHFVPDAPAVDVLEAASKAIRWVLRQEAIVTTVLEQWQLKIPHTNPTTESITDGPLSVGYWSKTNEGLEWGETHPTEILIQDPPHITVWLPNANYLDVELILLDLMAQLLLPNLPEKPTNGIHKSRRGVSTDP